MITNKQNLPEAFVKYASDGDRDYVPHRYSVTELLLPVREIILNRKHAHEIETDVADCIPALFGTAVHQVLENNAPVLESGIETEVSIECEFGDDVVAGRIDLLDLVKKEILDYKTCSVSKVMREDFNDWEMQNMIYSYLIFKKKDIVIRDLKDYALMKDWSKMKAATSSNYPQSPVYLFKKYMEDSDFDFIEKWIQNKLDLINKYIDSDKLPECTDEEKWYTGTKYAVYKNVSDKRAIYVADTEEDAHNYIHNKLGAAEIEVRKGEYLKCKLYCSCYKFCKKGENQ